MARTYDGGMESLRTAKLTKRRKSVNLEPWSTLGGVSDPLDAEGPVFRDTLDL